MTLVTARDVQQFTLAYFGRPADPKSLVAWPATGLRIEEIVSYLVASDEYGIEMNKLNKNENVNTTEIDIKQRINL